MAGISVGAGWVAHPTPKALARWDRLNVPRLGQWAEAQPPGLAGLPRPPAARYPTRIEPNVVYWPTHLGGFAFGWFLIRKADLLAPKPTWFHPSLRVPNYLWLHLFPEGPLPQHFPVGGSDADAGPVVGMWGLAEYALSVVGDGEELWAVPCVDDRFFWKEDYRDGLDPGGNGSRDAESRYARLKDLVTDSFSVPGQGLRGLSYMGLGENFPVEFGGPEFDTDFPIDLGPLTVARGTGGDLADCALGMMGMRGCFSPPSYGDVPRARGQDFARASSSLDAWFADPRVQIRDGSPPGLSPDPPFAVGQVTVTTTDGWPWTFAAAELLTGVGPSNHTLPLSLPVRLTRDTQVMVEHPKAREAARRMAASLLAWLLKPFMVRTAGAVRGCDSALVGMWEFHNGATVAHGLAWDTWWAGPPAPRPDAVTVRYTSGGWRVGPMAETISPGGTHIYTVGGRGDNAPVSVGTYGGGLTRAGIDYAAVCVGTSPASTLPPASLGEYGGVAPPPRSISLPAYNVVGEAWELGDGTVNELPWQQFASPKGFPNGVGFGPRQGQGGFGQSFQENAVLLAAAQGYGTENVAWVSAPGPQNAGPNGGHRGAHFAALTVVAGGPGIGTNPGSPGGTAGWFGMPPFPGQVPMTPGGFGIGSWGGIGYFGQAFGIGQVAMDNLAGGGAAQSVYTLPGGASIVDPPWSGAPAQSFAGSGIASTGYLAALGGFMAPIRSFTSGAGEAGWARGRTDQVPTNLAAPGGTLGGFPPDPNGPLTFLDGLYVGGGKLLMTIGILEGPFDGHMVNVAHGGTGNGTLSPGKLLMGDGANPTIQVDTVSGGTF